MLVSSAMFFLLSSLYVSLLKYQPLLLVNLYARAGRNSTILNELDRLVSNVRALLNELLKVLEEFSNSNLLLSV